MANPGYVRSTDGDNADNGSTWALANADLSGATADDSAGDTIYISHQHAEITPGSVTLAWAGTLASPQRIICANDSAEPPTAVATTATVTVTGSNILTWGNSATTYTYVYGITFNGGTGVGSNDYIKVAGNHTFEACNFNIVASGGSSHIWAQNAAATAVYRNCGFSFAATGQSFQVSSGNSEVIVRGGSILAGSSAITTLMTGFSASGGRYIFDGFDMSNAGSSLNLCSVTDAYTRVTFRDCKLPSGWSGAPHSSTPGRGSVVEMINCDSGDTNYRYRKATQFGTIQDETTLVRTGGASDGTTTYSLKMVTNGNAEYPLLTLDSPELKAWNETTGSSKTATVEILHDSATALKDDEIWLEAMYLGTSGYPLGSIVSDSKADVLASAANQASSSATWTTTGMSNPNTQKLSVSFTPQEKGPVVFVVRMAKASYTVYVDPKVAIA